MKYGSLKTRSFDSSMPTQYIFYSFSIIRVEVKTIYSELFFCRRLPLRLYKAGTKCKLHYRQVIYLWKNTYLFNAPSPRQPSLRLSHLRQCNMHLTMCVIAKREFESFKLHVRNEIVVLIIASTFYIDLHIVLTFSADILKDKKTKYLSITVYKERLFGRVEK